MRSGGEGARLPAALEVIAHRGASSVAPENTLASFRAALEQGAGSLEMDVRATRDGTPILLHDAQLERIDRVMVQSFEMPVLKAAREAAPDLALGALFGLRWDGGLPSLPGDVGTLALHWSTFLVRPGVVRAAHARDKRVLAWTVNDSRLARYLASLAVDGLITDRPDIAK